MIFDNLNPSQQRHLAIGLMLFTLLSITLVIVMPLVTGYTDNQARIAQLQQQLIRYKDQVANRPTLVTQTTELKKSILASGIFSTQKSVSLVLAELQEKITTVITSAGGELSSAQNLAQKPINRLIRLGINVSFSGKIDHLKHILFDLESAKPYLMVENIKIYGASNQRGTHGNIDAANKIKVIADIVTYIPSVSNK